MKNLLSREPALAGAVASLVGAIIGMVVGNEALAAALGGVVLAMLGVRQTVTPVAKADERIVNTARAAALETASRLTDGTIGAAGEVTQAAKAVVGGVVADVVNPMVRTR